MTSVLTGNRSNLQFMTDEDIHGIRSHAVPGIKPVTEKLRTLTKRYAEESVRRAKANISATGASVAPKTREETILKVNNETADMVIESLVGA